MDPSAPLLGSRGFTYSGVEDPDWPQTRVSAITALDAFASRSFEELRFEDSFLSFHLRRAPRNETVLERDVLGAIGELVLDQAQWWEAFEADEAPMLEAVVARTTRAVCGDAAYYVLQWMTPTACRARHDGVDLRLSRLMDYLPERVAAATTFQEGIEREQFVPETLVMSDRYLMLAWAALRCVFMSDAQAWPNGWGVDSCPCSCLRPLADAVATHMMTFLDDFRRLETSSEANRVSEARVQEVTVRGDPPPVRFLIPSLAAHVPTVLNDMETIREFSRHYLHSILKTHNPSATAISPAPVQGAYLRENGAVPVSSSFSLDDSASSEDVCFVCSVSESGEVTDVIQGDSTWGSKLDLLGLIHDLVPMYEKAMGESAQSYSNTLLQGPPRHGPSSWISLPDRAVLSRTSSCIVPSKVFSLGGKRLQLVASIVSAPVASTDSEIARKREWIAVNSKARNAAAFAVVLLQSGNDDAPTMHVRFPPDPNGSQHLPVATNQDTFGCLPREQLSISFSCSSSSNSPSKSCRYSVLPAHAEFRLASADPTKPSSWVVAVVTLCNPWEDALSATNAAKSSQLERSEFNFVARSQSAEEDRFAHYRRHRDPARIVLWEYNAERTSTDSLTPLYSLRTQVFPLPKDKRKGFGLELCTRQHLCELTNPPRWWLDHNTDAAIPLEVEHQRQYVTTILEDELKRSLQGLADELTKTKRNPDEQAPTDASFRDAAAFFVRLSMLKKLHQAFAAGVSGDWVVPVQEIVDLIHRYRSASDADKISQLTEFVGRDYPVEHLVPHMNQACTAIQDRGGLWSQRFMNAVDACRTAAMQDGCYSPAPDTFVHDGLVESLQNQVVEALDALRGEIFSSPVVLRLVDPSYYSTGKKLIPSLATFSARQSGSIAERMEATIQVKAIDGEVSRAHWVPSDVSINMDGTVRFRSYISSVPPELQSSTCEVVEPITAAFVPMFESLLTRLSNQSTDPLLSWFIHDSPSSPPNTASQWSLRGRSVQILVEVIDIVLPPGDTFNVRDKWHNCNRTSLGNIRADKNIVATGIYFAQVDNLATPRIHLKLRKAPDQRAMGFVDGYVGRGCVLANEYDRKFDPLRLYDPEKIGSLQLIVVHLVNPNTPMITTANVSPQERETIENLTLGPVTQHYQLPTDVHELIASMVDFGGYSAEQRREMRQDGEIEKCHSSFFAKETSTTM